MTGPIVSVEIGRSTWQGPAEEAPGGAGNRDADMAECFAFSAGYEAGERDGRASGQQVRAALEGAVNWLDALLALVQETSCDPDDPEAFDEVVMAAGMWLSRARAALATPTEGGSDERA